MLIQPIFVERRGIFREHLHRVIRDFRRIQNDAMRVAKMAFAQRADAAEMHVLTKNLAMAKMKLALLKAQVKSVPAAYQDTVSCLFAETEQYIESLRNGRNSIVGRRRS